MQNWGARFCCDPHPGKSIRKKLQKSKCAVGGVKGELKGGDHNERIPMLGRGGKCKKWFYASDTLKEAETSNE